MEDFKRAVSKTIAAMNRNDKVDLHQKDNTKKSERNNNTGSRIKER